MGNRPPAAPPPSGRPLHNPPDHPPHSTPDSLDPLQERLHRWQSCRSWARLIREAESLWHVDVRSLHRLAAQELVQLVQEVPPRLRRRVNRWLERFHVSTRLH